MSYHLDTNVCVAALKGVVTVQDRIRAHADDLAISTVVLGELYCGAFRSQRVAHNLDVLAEFVAGIEVIPFDTEAARAYGTLCAELLRMGRPTGEKDALIAAIAKRHGATLVTHNTRHFQHISDLVLEDWLT
ncbi:MAG: type II toxin-antitoxin system VapC family toxin [Nitrospira sp. LK70]|nr:type II toxin-antitoxin system VapC family toxin [Nitrospira sp. LK70]